MVVAAEVTVDETKLPTGSTTSFSATSKLICAIRATQASWCHLFCYRDHQCLLSDFEVPQDTYEAVQGAVYSCWTRFFLVTKTTTGTTSTAKPTTHQTITSTTTTKKPTTMGITTTPKIISTTKPAAATTAKISTPTSTAKTTTTEPTLPTATTPKATTSMPSSSP
ncbi:integumentary mucin C.1-like [Penaeus chinensis]|uniref:integumentary mucin C.1-like n=1 Tax=Penaeus chinensis TaxID=139456 RepID=UPI001FB61015|nr:integumentary mucin C.1-like [Penaeus chinensis]